MNGLGFITVLQLRFGVGCLKGQGGNPVTSSISRRCQCQLEMNWLATSCGFGHRNLIFKGRDSGGTDHDAGFGGVLLFKGA
jgi:hypothetical protein